MMNHDEMRQLDAFIAKYVMGYSRWHARCMHASDGRTFYKPDTGSRHRWLDEFGPHSESWTPTTDPAAAMEVLKKIATAHRVDNTAVWWNGGFWHAGHGKVVASADTLEKAICYLAKSLFSRPNHGGGK
jgi:hypothetical protein